MPWDQWLALDPVLAWSIMGALCLKGGSRVNQLLRTLAVCLLTWLVICGGCDESGETKTDASTPGLGEVAGESQETEVTCATPTVRNPLLGCPEFGQCAATVCDSGGITRDEMRMELKTFWKTQPTCTELPVDIHCRNKSVEYGVDWPEQLEADIQSAAEKSGGFSDEQIQALRCLGIMEPGNALKVAHGDAGSMLPSMLLVGLEMPGPAAGVSLHDEFLDRFGALVGTILHITDDYEFEQRRKPPGDDVELRLSLVSYKGIPADPERKLSIDVNLGYVYWPEGPDNTKPCPNRWVFFDLSTTLSRHIETLEVAPEKLVKAGQALTAALTECGDDCSYPVTDWEVDSGPSLFITEKNVIWRVTVNCPVKECDDEPWMCTYRIDAETGAVLSGGRECCIDCPGLEI
jgi:hypothetical protein